MDRRSDEILLRIEERLARIEHAVTLIAGLPPGKAAPARERELEVPERLRPAKGGSRTARASRSRGSK